MKDYRENTDFKNVRVFYNTNNGYEKLYIIFLKNNNYMVVHEDYVKGIINKTEFLNGEEINIKYNIIL